MDSEPRRALAAGRRIIAAEDEHCERFWGRTPDQDKY